MTFLGPPNVALLGNRAVADVISRVKTRSYWRKVAS